MCLKFQCLFTFYIINVIYLDSVHIIFRCSFCCGVGGFCKTLTYCARAYVFKHVRTFYAFFDEINDEQWMVFVLTMSLPTYAITHSKHALILVRRTRNKIACLCVCTHENVCVFIVSFS